MCIGTRVHLDPGPGPPGLCLHRARKLGRSSLANEEYYVRTHITPFVRQLRKRARLKGLDPQVHTNIEDSESVEL